jgi:quinol monooxygenase YgiN
MSRSAATTELFVFARFHARSGQEAALERALREVLGPTRDELGCLSIGVYRSVRDSGLFYVHSRWASEAAFDLHGDLPHTSRFLARVQPLIDHPLDITRAAPLD